MIRWLPRQIPNIVNVILIMLMVYLIFAILGVQLYGGKLWYCSNYDPAAVIITKLDCWAHGGSWQNQRQVIYFPATFGQCFQYTHLPTTELRQRAERAVDAVRGVDN